MAIYEFVGSEDTEFMKNEDDKSHSSLVTTYHIKTSMLWLCEKVPVSEWTHEKLSERLYDLLDFLIASLQRRCLEHYFVSSFNLFDRQECDEVGLQRDILIVEGIRLQLLHYIYSYLIRETHWFMTGWPDAHRSLQRIVNPLSAVVLRTIKKTGPERELLFWLRLEIESHLYFMSSASVEQLSNVFNEYGYGAQTNRYRPTELKDFLNYIVARFPFTYVYSYIIKPLLEEFDNNARQQNKRILTKLVDYFYRLADGKEIFKCLIAWKIAQLTQSGIAFDIDYRVLDFDMCDKQELKRYPVFTTWFLDRFFTSTDQVKDVLSKFVCFKPKEYYAASRFGSQFFIIASDHLTISDYYEYKTQFLIAFNQYLKCGGNVNEVVQAKETFDEYQVEMVYGSQNRFQQHRKAYLKLEPFEGSEATIRSYVKVSRLHDSMRGIDICSTEYRDYLKKFEEIQHWDDLLEHLGPLFRSLYQFVCRFAYMIYLEFSLACD